MERESESTRAAEIAASVTRREALVGAGALAALAGGIARVVQVKGRGAAATTAATASPSSTLAALPALPVLAGAAPPPAGAAPATPTPTAPAAAGAAMSPEAKAAHAVRRLSFGPTPESMAEAQSMGAEAWIARQLDPGSIDDSRTDELVSSFWVLSMDPGALDLPNGQIDQQEGELAFLMFRHATLVRMATTQRQLYEVMVDFWTNHFQIWPDKDSQLYALKPVDDRETIRPHALGRFADMLRASAQSPAMLMFLDNDSSKATAPNENYARELLELHTVGVESGFTENDVVAAARILTGWSANPQRRFVFFPEWHDTAPQQVLGWSTPGHAGPEAVADGESLLDYLAHHPSTANHLATKLVRRLVADDPPADIVAAAADAYLTHDTAIAPMVAAIVGHEGFFASAATKLRRPLEYFVASLRATNASVGLDTGKRSTADGLDQSLLALGQRLYDWVQPDGYPDRSPSWLGPGLALARWNAAAALAANHLAGVGINHDGLVPGVATAGELVDAVFARIALAGVDPDRRAAALAFLGVDAAAPADRARLPELVGLALASQEMQFR